MVCSIYENYFLFGFDFGFHIVSQNQMKRYRKYLSEFHFHSHLLFF